jgi:3-phosphoshikimate 1-carboxyvinyltransferase
MHTDLVISPARLSGSIAAIPSKSYAVRILIAAALSEKPTELLIDYLSDDVRAALSALTSMGAQFEIYDDRIIVTPLDAEALPHHPIMDCGESGTLARLLLPVATALFEQGTLIGTGSLLKRPFEILCKTLEQSKLTQDSQVQFDRYNLPISWKGRLQPGTFQMPGDESSQYLSALLYALPLLPAKSSVKLSTSLESAGYVDMTRDVLSKFGISSKVFSETGAELGKPLESAAGTEYFVEPGQYLSPGSMSVEGDWSNSAVFLVAGVEVTGLNPDSLQRDRHFLTLKDQQLIDATNVPDLVPILGVCAALRTEITRIRGIKRLRLKESDRIQTTLALLQDLGCTASLCADSKDELIICGRGEIPGGGIVEGAGDHRIVMAAALAASFANKSVTLKGAQAVAKTYARFFTDFKQLGGRIDVI